jgi:Holliday junction DNA helicase RuvA
MIARLRGRLDTAGHDQAVIDVGGVGYLVFCSARTLNALPAPGEMVDLLVETQMREDHISLYGFASEAERRWFRLLLTVQGVGSRVALAVLSALGADELATAIAAHDTATLRRVPGIGPKAASRMVTELKDRAIAAAPQPAVAAAAAAPIEGDASAEAISALVNLGYGRGEAYGAVAAAARALGEGVDAAGLIRRGLRELAPT